MAVSDFDYAMMARALRLAEQGLYSTAPNPRVGCVICKQQQVIAEGYHQVAGQGHAEVNALAQAGESARGATAYVTLEPCSHHGKTPPCAMALIQAGVERVVVAMTDPNPLVSGRGIEALQAAGIVVESGVMQTEAEQLNLGFIKRMRTGMPYVRAKVAVSLDGRTAMASGESQWITGPAARQDVQRLRARSDAIITGSQTVCVDNPRFTIRPEQLGHHQTLWQQHGGVEPWRVIVDSQLVTSAQAQIYQLSPAHIWLATACQDANKLAAFRQLGIEPKPCDVQHNHLDLTVLLQQLAQAQCNEVLLESGPNLTGAMLQQQLVDELVVYMAPKLMGDQALPLAYLPQIQTMQQSLALRLTDLRQIGDDIRLVYQPSNQP